MLHLARPSGESGSIEAENECEILQNRLDVSILNEADTALAKLFVRILCRHRLEQASNHSSPRSESVEVMAPLESNEDKFPSDRIAELEMVADAVLSALPRRFRLAEDELVRLMCAEQCNSFGIWGRAGPSRAQLVGYGLFPALCALNHACLPNCTVAQEPRPARRALAVRTLAPVAAGDELCISYSGRDLLAGPAAARAAWLAATYHFHCRCALCRAADDDPRAARALARAFDARHRCPAAACGGLLVPTPPTPAPPAGPAAGGKPAAAGAEGGKVRLVCGGCGGEWAAAE